MLRKGCRGSSKTSDFRHDNAPGRKKQGTHMISGPQGPTCLSHNRNLLSICRVDRETMRWGQVGSCGQPPPRTAARTNVLHSTSRSPRLLARVARSNR